MLNLVSSITEPKIGPIDWPDAITVDEQIAGLKIGGVLLALHAAPDLGYHPNGI
jgi:hypothetical protein